MLARFFNKKYSLPGGSSAPRGSNDVLPDSAGQPTEIKVYVSLTTIPSRINRIHRCIESLLAQTLKPEKVFLCVPSTYKRFGVAANIPESLGQYGDRLQIVRCREDYGPGTKLLGSVDLVPRQPNCLMTLVDDDVVYKDYMLEVFANAYRKQPQHSFSFHVSSHWYQRDRVGYGVTGLALPATCLDGIWPFYRKIQNNEYVFFIDDLWISYFLHVSGIPLVSLAKFVRGRGRIFKIYNDADALERLRGEFSRRKCMAQGRKFLRATLQTHLS